ncbi:hypothetical protein COEREDRAFT_86231 [Coemansia reversa NRRL 1564]|uniref:Uncharacterized protein n=1 Tax=Coemansia reversa (strain ATCC 12441 / NRRL 1564) TaxID=763665 RepID=A0A2G5BE07_COERN|nr:hypothetical protein COEREDRAFT_86231 [Coemansia reversa NRRL 1564]|eukprot:PIA17231.1 hypothetical protein COEREDRAFT_86231 [Coemansia reversa NRRL 1564]
MRFITVATIAAAAACVAASPFAAPNYGGNVAQVIGAPILAPPPIIGGYPHPGYPGGGPGHGNDGPGNGDNGSDNDGSHGGGHNGGHDGGHGGGHDGGHGGPIGNPADCGLRPGQKAALTPLLRELKLTRTVDDLKHLTHQITDLLADTLQEDAVSSLLNVVDSLVAGLGLGGLDLQPAVDSVTSILRKQVPCLVDTLLPKP